MQVVNLPASIAELDHINEMIAQIVTEQSLVFKVQLIVEELLTNIASYAYEQDEPNKYLRFVCGYVYFDGKKAILLQLVYGGVAFDPFIEVKDPDITQPITERDIGGLGMHLIKEIATHYTYARLNDANQVQIYLDVPAADAAPGAPQ